MYRYAKILSALSLLTLWQSAMAGSETDAGFAEGGAVFLKLPADAKTAALGGAMTAWRLGGAGVHHNPALLSAVPGFRGQGMYSYLPLDQNHESIRVSYPFHKQLTGGFSYIRYGVDDIERRDDFGILNGNFGYGDNSIALSLASNWKDRVALGLRTRYITSKLDDALSYGFGLDIGILYTPSSFVSFGFSALNLGSEVTWSTGHSDEVLAELRGGLFVTLLDSSLSFSGDVENTKHQPFDGALAAEYIILKVVSVRAGMTYLRDPDYTFGAGVTHNNFEVDYGMTIPASELGFAHRISLSYSFSFAAESGM